MNFFKSNIDAILFSFLGVAIVLLLTKHSGLGISPDSVYYMSTGDSILAGTGFYQFDGKPFVMFPVGYPIIIALLKAITGSSFLSVVPFFNALLFGFTILIAGLIFKKTNHSKWLTWTVLAIITLSPSLLEVYTMLWSETLFITEVLLFIYVGKNYFETYNYKSLIIMALIAAIAADTRLAGVSIIATGGLLILMSNQLNWGKKILHAFIFGIISTSLFLINLIRNAFLTQTLTGIRQKGVTPLLENLKYYGLVLTNWLPFSKWTNLFPTLVGFLFLVLVTCIFIYQFLKLKEQPTYQKLIVAFTLMYSLFMLTVATVSRFETINNRLLAPMFIPCVLTIIFFGASIFNFLKVGRYKIGLILFCSLLIVATLIQYTKVDKMTYQENIEGGIGGYSDDDWYISSGLLNYLHSNSNTSLFNSGKTVYSNAAHAVYFKTSQPTQILPERKYTNLVADFNKMPTQILIWFNNEDNPEVLTLQEVSATKNLQIIGKFNDGVIYLCTSK